MSELREELLGTTINKKRILGLLLVVIILISMFAFSVVLVSYLFGSQRPFPSREKATTEDETVQLNLPPFPFDEEFWQDLLDQVDDPASLLDMLSEMLDGDIDDLDLGNFSQGLLDLLYSGAGEIELFRVYNYLSFNDMSDVLWKFETFDEYTGEGWISNAGTDIYDFFSYGEYLADILPPPPPDPELLKLKMPLSPDIGINAMVMPTLFPTPFVINEPPYLISTNPNNLIPGTPTLYKDEYNSTTIDLSFSSDVDVNMTFNMFGLYNYLPTNEDLNGSAVLVTSPSPEYLSLESKYLQLPPTIDIYRSNNPYFNTHLNTLNTTVINPNDHTFWIANKIRNYLQTQFSFPMNPDDYNPAPEGRDAIDWFCETEQGVWSDFASAFCAFSRAFGVISRFVDGFNSLMIEEFTDPYEPPGENIGFAIKYKNLYSWAEIYVPTDDTGNGKWVQFDIFDSFGGGGSPIIGGNYNITVSTDQTAYIRPDTASITAAVSSSTDPIDNLTITFRDYTTGRVLGQDDTDMGGIASIQTDFNASELVGPHLIEGRYDFFTAGYNLTTILGDISIVLTDVNPGEINVSDAQQDITNVIGYVEDPLNSRGVKGPELNIILLEKGTTNEISPAFLESAINTTTNGDFNDFLELIHNTAGNYEIRADLNGTWWIDTPFGISSYFLLSLIFQVPYYSFTNSSNRMDFNITKALDVWFSINGLPSNYPNSPPNYPISSRYQTLNLSAEVISSVYGPMPNKQVYFYDYSRGDVMIGSDISDSNGIASINYLINDYCRSGPNLLYARIGLQENYSYFILNEDPTINIISGPTPRVINRTGSGVTQFNIVGEIYDSTNTSLPISFSQIALKLLRGGGDYSSYLTPSEFFQTDSNGYFNLNFGVTSNTPPGNYTLRLDFNGTVNLGIPYSYLFSSTFINTSIYFSNDLKIDAETSLLFWINGETSDYPFIPEIKRGEKINLTARVHQAGTPIVDGELVEFYDITQGLFIGSDTTNGGNATIIYPTNRSIVAGPHLIYATWNNKFNYSYFIFDASINVTLDICPLPREINRTGSIDTFFSIHGYLKDSINNQSIKNGEIEVRLYDGPLEVSFYLNEPRYVLLDETGEIDLLYSVASDTPAKNYTLRVLFYGMFDYTSNPYYPQFFNLNYISNYTYVANGIYPLKVKDPYNISIYLTVEGNPTLTFYDNNNPPERFNPGEKINFSVYIIQSGNPVDFGTVRIYDVYDNNQLLDSHTYNISVPGYHEFLINTATWLAGLHYIKVNWSSFDTSNTTYVIINKSISLFANSNRNLIQRDVHSFRIYGTVQDGSIGLRGLQVTFLLLDNNNNDVTYLVHFSPTSQQNVTIYNDGSGYYQFDVDYIDLGCLQGVYSVRIDFNGSMDAPGIFLTKNSFMSHTSSSPITLNITAGTYITGNYDTRVDKEEWYFNDDLYVYGFLYWDNGTAMAFMEVNVTIRDGVGNVLASEIGFTLFDGSFNITLKVGAWPPDTEVWVHFFPEDNFGVPEMYYVSMADQQVFREP
jgi:hypothetical protein